MVPSRNYVLVASAAQTASSTGNIIVLPADYSSCILVLNTSAVSGTSPTMNVYIQEAFRVPASSDVADITTGTAPSNYTVFDDVVSWTQVIGTGTQVLRWVGGGNTMNSVSDAALAAGSVRNGPLGQAWRVKWVLGGTSPSFTFSLYGKFIF